MRLLRRGCCSVLLFVSFAVGIFHSQEKAPASGQNVAFSTEPKDVASAASKVKAEQDAPVTFLTNEVFLTLDSADRATYRSHRVYRVESTRALPWAATVKVNYSPWRQNKPVVRARVIAPNGSVSTLDPKTLTETPAHDQRPILYEDDRTLSGPLPSVTVGSIVEEEIITEDTAPIFDHGTMSRIYLGGKGPDRRTLLEIRAPQASKLHYKVRGTPAPKVAVKEESGVTVLRFEPGTESAAEAREKDLPADFESWPAVDFSTGLSWSAVSAAYYQQISGAIRPKEVSSLLAGTSGLKGAELIRRIVTNLHKQVRYTGLEFGSSALLPNAAGETMKRGYGDCKDKAVALVSALQAAGVPAQLALLNTRGNDDISPDLSGIGLFDHAIVYIPGPPAMWIDATAEFSDPGSLPWGDQGRLALLIGPSTRDLVRTPVNQPAENARILHREFYLQEFGPARIVETLEPTGEQAAYMRRRFGQPETTRSREELDSYVQDNLLAKTYSSVERTPGDDLTKPFRLKLTVDKGERGSTNLGTAEAAIRYEDLLWGYPYYVLADNESENGTRHIPPREDAIEIQPFVTEWHFKIVPPPGFSHPVLPTDVAQSIGPANFTQRYHLQPDGSVDIVWRFDSVKPRYSPTELQALQRDASHLMDSEPVTIRFAETGSSLLAQGKSREALAYYSDLIKAHPQKAVYHLNVAEALLKAGFGTQARKEARRATELEPGNSLTWVELGSILEHDEIGRHFRMGFDLNGAISAYRKAIELEPKVASHHFHLADVLEHGPAGPLYSRDSRLDEAVAEYRIVIQLDPDMGHAVTDNMLYDLFHLQKWDDVQQTLHSVPPSAWRQSLALAVIAARGNVQAALAESEHLDRALGTRKDILLSAAQCLLETRRYSQAAALTESAIGGAEDSSHLRPRIAMLQKALPYEQVLLPANDPRRAVQEYYLTLLNPLAQPPDWNHLIVVDPADEKNSLELMAQAGQRLRASYSRNNLPSVVMSDVVLSNLQMSAEGNEASGYRIHVSHAPNNVESVLVASRQGRHVIVAIDRSASMAGDEVLRHLAASDLSGAKQWLDWTREQFPSGSGDDPAGGFPFPRFWNRGDAPDAARMRLAALSLLATTSAIGPHLDEVKTTRNGTSDAVTALNLDVLLAQAAYALRDWKLYREVALRLYAESPMSNAALGYMVSAAVYSHDWNMAQKAIADRLSRLPDDAWAMQQSAALAANRGEFAQSRKILRPLIDANRASIVEINQYAWSALFLGNVTQADVDVLQRAMIGNKKGQFEVFHTLACLYADTGKTKEARETLLQAMDIQGLDEPNDAIWLGFGRIAQQYGLNDVAQTLYGRVSDGPYAVATSNSNLAQLWETTIHSGVPAPTRAAVH